MRAPTAEQIAGKRPHDPASVLSPIAHLISTSSSASTSLGRLFSPALDLITRFWLAQGFLLTDVMQHMAPNSPAAATGTPWLLASIAGTNIGIAIQTICPLLLAAGLLTRVAAMALLVQVLALQMPGYAQLAPYSVALLGWIIVSGPGPLSLDWLLGSGMSATALPLVRPISQASAALTRRFGPTYSFLLRFWIAAVPAAVALGAVHTLDGALPGGMTGWLPQMPGMVRGIAPWLLLILATALALGLFTRLSALVLILLLSAGEFMLTGPHLDWLLLLNLLLLGLPLLHGPGPISLDYAIVAALRRRFPPFEALRPETVAQLPHIVVVGGGFGGVAAARALRYAPCRVTLLDQNNYHLFQPLLYQVATAGLSPADIATPLREMFRSQANVRVLLGQITGIDSAARQVLLGQAALPYDVLVLATGAQHSYFGRDQWAPLAPGLKGIGDALDIRRRLLLAFEEAENSSDGAERRAWLTFVIVGGGPTGVELAGAIAELARHGFTSEFRTFDPATARIMLVQSAERLLPTFPKSLSVAAERSLKALGVEVLTGCKVTAIDAGGAVIAGERVAAHSIVWAAGVAASPAAEWLGVEADSAGRLKVGPDLRVPGWPEIFAIGDTAACDAWKGKSVPGLAPAAKQGGAYAAKVIRAALTGKAGPPPFRYRHYGSLATIGRQSAVADFGWLRVRGAPAWWLWGAAHVTFLVGARNRLTVLVAWLWAYLTFRRSTRLITGPGS